MHMKRQLLAVFVLVATATAGVAQEWPAKPVKLIVPFPPGGGTDIISRVLANRLSESLRQSFIVENKPGAGGNIGVDQTAKSAPDGYTIVMGQTSNLAINPSLYANLPYDPIKDLTPVALVADAPVAFVTNATSELKSVSDVLAAAKKKPGEITLGTPGNGTVAHLTGELLQKTAGIKLLHVPYKGSAPALTDLMGGRIDLFVASVPTVLGQVKAGKLQPVAVSTKERSPSLPGVPTIAEAGVAGFDATTWFGILAPARTPDAIVVKLNAAINDALKSVEVGEKIAAEGGKPRGGTSTAFADLIKADLVSWATIVKDSGAKLD